MGKQPQILIIEDDTDTSAAMTVTLEAQNFQVSSVENPEDGMQKAKQTKPDVIILDVMFGEKDKSKGFDFAIKMKKNKALAGIPILMITAVNVRHPGFSFSPDTDGEYLPVDDFIDKPAQPDDLVKKVKKLLEQKVSKWVSWPQPGS